MTKTHVLTASLFLMTAPVFAGTITADYSGLGTVYQDAAGQLYSTAAAGRTDVTAVLKSDIGVAIGYLTAAVGVNWSETIGFTLADLSGDSAVADSAVTGTDMNGRPNASNIRIDNSGSQFYFDSTPWDNSEFTIAATNGMLGGGTVNVGRIGNAVMGNAAAGKWDFLTIAIHEIEHSQGYSSGLQRFLDLAGASGTVGRKLTVDTTLSGLTNSFDIPLVSNSAHIDGTAQSGLFNNSVVAEPGFGIGQRALLSGAEIYGLCVIEGCTAAQVNTNPTPEPGTIMLLSLAGSVVLIGRRRRQA